MKVIHIESGTNWTYAASPDFSKFGWIVFSYQFGRFVNNHKLPESGLNQELTNITFPIECINEHCSTLTPYFVERPNEPRAPSSSIVGLPQSESIPHTLSRLASARHKDTPGSRNPIAFLEINNSSDGIRLQCEGVFASTVSQQFNHLFSAIGISVAPADYTISSKLGFELPARNPGCDISISIPANLFFDSNYSNITGFTNKVISTIAFGLNASSSVIADSMPFTDLAKKS
ncbi:MAG TPA: hypothetical protein PLZ57_09440 [Pseudobdellovibrionaceae bacterium]|nr:hypothetical protein [Pseudobdellovibrionaceae bacterium]